MPVQEKLPSRESTSATEGNARKILSTKRGPAAIAAAGKELIQTVKNDVNVSISSRRKFKIEFLLHLFLSRELIPFYLLFFLLAQSVRNHQPSAVRGNAIRPNPPSFTRQTDVDNLLYGDPLNSVRNYALSWSR